MLLLLCGKSRGRYWEPLPVEGQVAVSLRVQGPVRLRRAGARGALSGPGRGRRSHRLQHAGAAVPRGCLRRLGRLGGMVTEEMAWAPAVAPSLLASRRAFLVSGVSARTARPQPLTHGKLRDFLWGS